MTNKQSTMKIWNVLFVCLNFKKVAMYMTPGYRICDFLFSYSSHMRDHGISTMVHSDRVGQLVPADKELANFDWDSITSKSSTLGTNRVFVLHALNGEIELLRYL